MNIRLNIKIKRQVVLIFPKYLTAYGRNEK